MTLKDISFRAGIIADASELGAKSYWTDSDRIRFVRALPKKLGGWVKNISTQFIGVCRGMLTWLDNEGIARAALGTHLKFMILDNNVFTDVTPIESSGTLANPFTTTSGSPIVNVNDVAHARNVGDYVHFSGAAAVGGITINGEYTVTAFVDSDNYTITHSANASSSAGPGGGAAVAFEYEIGVGNVDGTQGAGYGVGTYGTGTYGTARSGYILLPPRTWSIDQWSDWIVACPRDGKIFQFENDIGARGTIISQAPFPNLGIWVTAEQHLVAYGAGGNKMEVDWCSQENFTIWTPSDQNTAGSRVLTGGSEIQFGIRTRGGNLLVTDAAVWFMQFIGGLDVFGFDQVAGANAGAVGPKAVCEVDGVVFWMGISDFYYFDGAVHRIPRSDDIKQFVFKNLSANQRAKCWATSVTQFGEIWFFYPTSAEITRYVKFNYKDQCWDIGQLVRTAGIDRGIFAYPMMAAATSYLYDHENGDDDDGAAMNEFIVSGPLQLADGDYEMEVVAVVPDFEEIVGTLHLGLHTRHYAQGSEAEDSLTVTGSSDHISARATGRQVELHLSSSDIGTRWHLGQFTFDMLRGPRR